ncbi:MAG: hypothetical protein ABJC13_13460 [Acidobacteriota bacterium]
MRTHNNFLLALGTTALLALPIQAASPANPPAKPMNAPMAAKADVETFTGWITDNCDGVHGASTENTKAKVQGCKERGGRVVFYNVATKKFYDLDKIDLALDNVGHPVTVTGVRDWNLIKVESIVPQDGVQNPS